MTDLDVPQNACGNDKESDVVVQPAMAGRKEHSCTKTATSQRTCY